MLLKFRYVNWRGDDHEYVIDIMNCPKLLVLREDHWWLSGFLVTRNGDSRPEMGEDRRRSFRITEMRDIEEVERSA